MYIYGGFSFDCRTACYDLWRYEIAYGPMGLFPAQSADYTNYGNHWTLMSEDENYSPGARWRASATPYQREVSEKVSKEEHFLYIFGGIKVLDEITIKTEAKEYLNEDYLTSFEYMSDLWRFNLISNQWEDLEVYGISSIKRQIFLWNG
mmetsp:Transcript_19394/g.13925  ORF Transcript_19394/g.13925 Transcript_19394/m.13925 type:complete len:149 (+) Transcript_19394:127-573(+)